MKNAIVCILLIIIMTISVASAERLIIGKESNEPTVQLLSSPERTSSSVGEYYSGVYVSVIQQTDDWALVEVESNSGAARQSGFVAIDNLSACEVFDIDVKTPAVRVVANQGETKIPLKDGPNEASSPIGSALSGTMVKLLGIVENHGHIMLGNGFTAFVSEEHILPDAETLYPDTTMRSMGYCRITAEDTKEKITTSIHVLPDDDSEILYELSQGYGAWLELIAELGEWCQVRAYSDDKMGFIRSEMIDTYELMANNPTEPIALPKGKTIIGQDIASGLYTINTGDDAIISVEYDGTVCEFHLLAVGSYTYFFPEGSIVTASDEHLLNPTRDGYVTNEESSWKTHGNGRFLLGEQIQRGFGEYMTLGTVELFDASEYGYYEMSDLLGNTQERVEMKKDVVYYPDGPKGLFIQIQNGVIEVVEPKG